MADNVPDRLLDGIRDLRSQYFPPEPTEPSETDPTYFLSYRYQGGPWTLFYRVEETEGGISFIRNVVADELEHREPGAYAIQVEGTDTMTARRRGVLTARWVLLRKACDDRRTWEVAKVAELARLQLCDDPTLAEAEDTGETPFADQGEEDLHEPQEEPIVDSGPSPAEEVPVARSDSGDPTVQVEETPQDFQVPQAAMKCSDDFRSVVWGTEQFSFTAQQAACIGVLWKHWQNGTPEIGQDYIMEHIDSSQNRLRDVFKAKTKVHAAWGRLIIEGQTKGAYRLSEPKNF